MPRFVIQHHSCPPNTHWDLMLEHHQTLATWQVPVDPADWSEEPTLCTKLADHRLHYLTYQGPLTRNRGSVRIAARGTYKPHISTRNHWRIHLTGDTIDLTVELNRLEADNWSLLVTERHTTTEGSVK